MGVNFVLASQEILTVPRTRRELSWQLGAGGWKLPCFRFLLAYGLVHSHFELPRIPR